MQREIEQAHINIGPEGTRIIHLSGNQHLDKHLGSEHCLKFSNSDEIACFETVGYEFPAKYEATVQVVVQQDDLLQLPTYLQAVAVGRKVNHTATAGGSSTSSGSEVEDGDGQGSRRLYEVLSFHAAIWTFATTSGKELAVYFDGRIISAFAGWWIRAYEEVGR